MPKWINATSPDGSFDSNFLKQVKRDSICAHYRETPYKPRAEEYVLPGDIPTWASVKVCFKKCLLGDKRTFKKETDHWFVKYCCQNVKTLSKNGINFGSNWSNQAIASGKCKSEPVVIEISANEGQPENYLISDSLKSDLCQETI